MLLNELLEVIEVELKDVELHARGKDEKFFSLIKKGKEGEDFFNSEWSWYEEASIHTAKIENRENHSILKIYLSRDDVTLYKINDAIVVCINLYEDAKILKKDNKIIATSILYGEPRICQNWEDEEVFSDIWDFLTTESDFLDYLEVGEEFDYKKGSPEIIKKAIKEDLIKILEDE